MTPWYNDSQLMTPLFLLWCWLAWYALKRTRQFRRNLKVSKALRSVVRSWAPEARRGN